jgi:hypothetical protein
MSGPFGSWTESPPGFGVGKLGLAGRLVLKEGKVKEYKYDM